MNLLSESVASAPKYPRQSSTPRDREGRESKIQKETQRKARHLKPVWIVLLLLVPCLALTLYYARYGLTGPVQPDSIVPSPSYALVLFLVYLDSVGLVVLTLLLSRNLIKAYFEKKASAARVGVSGQADCGVHWVFSYPYGVVSDGRQWCD